MFCTKCGSQIRENDRFCPECGALIERPSEPKQAAAPAASPVVMPEAAPQPVRTAEPAPKKKKHTALWIVLTCIAVAVAAAAVILFVLRPWEKNERTEPQSTATEAAHAVQPGAAANETSSATAKPAAEPAVEATPEPTLAPRQELSPEEAVRAAFEKLSEMQSVHVDLLVDISIKIEMPALGISQDAKTGMNFGIDSDMVSKRARVEGTVAVSDEETDVLAYTEKVDGVTRTYASADGGLTWTKSDNAEQESDILADPAQSIDAWMKHAKNLKKIGPETMGAFETTVYAGTLSGEYLKDAAAVSGGDLFEGMDESILEELDDLPVKIWIDDESGCVVRFALDMQDAMKTLMDRTLADSMGELPEGFEVVCTVDAALIEFSLSQFNAIPPIEIPDAVRESKETPAPAEGSIVGTWGLYGGEDEETQFAVEYMLALGQDMVFTFYEDGTGSLMTKSQDGTEETEGFIYTLENGQIVIDGDGADYRIEGDLLYIDAGGVKLIFKRR